MKEDEKKAFDSVFGDAISANQRMWAKVGWKEGIEWSDSQAGEPIGFLFQHEETGLTEVVDIQQVEWDFEKNNPRWKKISPVYTTAPAAQINQQMIKALEDIAATGYSNIDRDKARAALAAVKEHTK